MLLKRYTAIGLSTICLLAILAGSTWAQQDPPALGDESQLIAVLKSDAELFDKAKACQRLAAIGTKDSVPALATLLADPELSHYARTGLEPIPDPAVDEALRAAMGELEGGLKVGVINSIGMRRDAKAVAQLTLLAGDSDGAVANAAVAALARIASPEAIALLQKAMAGAAKSPQLGDACLTAADMLVSGGKTSDAAQLYDAMLGTDLPKHQQTAALHGAIRALGVHGVNLLTELLGDEDKARFAVALRMAHEMDGDDVRDALVEALGKLPSSRKALVLYALGNRGDKKALPAVLKAVQDDDPELRIAAVSVLATLGDASAASVLLEAAADANEDLAAAARQSLADLPGEDVDAVLAERLPGSVGAQRLVLIELVGQRGIDSAVPTLLKLADDDEQALRVSAIAALGLTVDSDGLSTLIDKLIRPRSPEDAAAVKAALNKAVLRMPDRDACAAQLLEPLGSATVTAKGDLLTLLGVVGGTKALEGVAAAAMDEDDAVQDAATRVLGEWMSPDAAPMLLKLAKTLEQDKYKIRALRGYIRIPRQFGLPAEQRLAMCRTALAVAERDAERNLALDALTRLPSKETLNLVVSYASEPGLRDSACVAAVSIAEKLLQTDRAAVSEAMQKVIDVGATGETAVQARLLLRRSKR